MAKKEDKISKGEANVLVEILGEKFNLLNERQKKFIQVCLKGKDLHIIDRLCKSTEITRETYYSWMRLKTEQALAFQQCLKIVKETLTEQIDDFIDNELISLYKNGCDILLLNKVSDGDKGYELVGSIHKNAPLLPKDKIALLKLLDERNQRVQAAIKGKKEEAEQQYTLQDIFSGFTMVHPEHYAEPPKPSPPQDNSNPNQSA